MSKTNTNTTNAIAVVNKRYGKRDTKLADLQAQCNVNGMKAVHLAHLATAIAGVQAATLSTVLNTVTGCHLTTRNEYGVQRETIRFDKAGTVQLAQGVKSYHQPNVYGFWYDPSKAKTAVQCNATTLLKVGAALDTEYTNALIGHLNKVFKVHKNAKVITAKAMAEKVAAYSKAIA